MSYFVVDVEADGPSPSTGSIVCFGAALVKDPSITFYGKIKPIHDNWVAEALAISGFSREEHLGFDDPKEVMQEFNDWLEKNSQGRPVFISDNNGFDWQFINDYFHKYLNKNPFGFSSRRISDLYAGMQMKANASQEWKKYRKTNHDHNPVNDAIGNAEALLKLKELGLNVNY